jgi:uncharacterized membrane protein
MIRCLVRWVLAALYLMAGAAHLVHPAPFAAIVPGWVPWPGAVVALTGVSEALGAAALAQPWSARLRRAGAVGLALYALCVWPANVNHMLIDLARTDGGGLPLAYHVPRLAAQPLIVWAALWAGGVLDWPFRRRGRSGTHASAADHSAGR